MADDKKSFILYSDLISIVEKLIQKDRENKTNYSGELFYHILQYVNDKNPIPIDFIVEMAFEPIRLELDRYTKRRQRGSFHWNWNNGISPKNHSIRNSSQMRDWRKR